MTQKILWGICGLLIVAGIVVISRGSISLNSKKISGVFDNSNFNIGQPVEIPSKKQGDRDPQIYAKSVYLIAIIF